MIAYLIVLLMLLLALVAWYASKSDGQVDLDRAVKLYLLGLVLMFGGLYAWEVHRRDQRFENLFDITHSVAAVADSCGVSVAATLESLRAFEKVWPDTTQETP